MPEALNPVIESRRQAYIECLYERSGRSCGTYFGLLQEHITDLLRRDMEQMLDHALQQNASQHCRASA